MKEFIGNIFYGILRFVFWIWQAPQHILAHILILICGVMRKQYLVQYPTVVFVTLKRGNFAMSLGDIILVAHTWWGSGYANERLRDHEYGHTIQSHMLGPLYLIIIGIPSFTQNVISTMLARYGYSQFKRNYYNRFPENWADKLGGVKDR